MLKISFNIGISQNNQPTLKLPKHTHLSKHATWKP